MPAKTIVARTTLYLSRLRVRKERAKRGAIYSTAGYIATSAKRRLRIRSGASRRGSAPHAHTRGGLRLIQFAVDGNTAIIGPVKFPRSNQFNEPIPSIHEFGKTVVSLRKFKVYQFSERPYMGPTLQSLAKRGILNRRFSARLARII